MAKLTDIVFKVDEYFLNTRIRICLATDCRYSLSEKGFLDCHLKTDLTNS